MQLRVGVLALQGDFAAHVERLRRSGVEAPLVRRPRDLQDLDGLALPGGESSTMLRLMSFGGMDEALSGAIRAGLPTIATCAGMILLASEVRDPEQASLGLLDITVSRNGYGRQVHSGTHAIEGHGGLPDGAGIFIRAPRVTRVGASCEVLASRAGDPVLVRHASILAACFHPELEDAHPVYQLFLDGVRAQRRHLRPTVPHLSAEQA